MRIPRIFEPTANLQIDQELDLSTDGAEHVGRVLRMLPGEQIRVFNGTGCDYSAIITSADKRKVKVRLTEKSAIENESPLQIILGQVLSRGDKMEFTIQKAVELGVSAITPLTSRYCGVKLDQERLNKKYQQWQKIIISACEQCGRSIIPKLNPLSSLEQFIDQNSGITCLTFHPYANQSIAQLAISQNATIKLIVGSEGGLSSEEIELTRKLGCKEVLLGPRVLRTETAALCAISILQSCYGDLS